MIWSFRNASTFTAQNMLRNRTFDLITHFLFKDWIPKYTNTYLRSSRPEVFCKKAVLRNFAKFTGKPLCQSLFFNKFACRSEACNFIKQETLADFGNFIKQETFVEHLRWLFLLLVQSLSSTYYAGISWQDKPCFLSVLRNHSTIDRIFQSLSR